MSYFDVYVSSDYLVLSTFYGPGIWRWITDSGLPEVP